ncbi:MAG: mannose-6-phosphate isomerase, class I [Thermocrispum sp.]
MELLRNSVRHYAWGSRTAIRELTGEPGPAPQPEAELWMGTHPGDPSHVVDPDGTERSLLDLVSADPERHFGTDIARQWGNRLPFLLKILAAEQPLSIQVHPSSEQAAAGFAKEEAAGIARDAAHRNYPDDTSKPELLCALSEFHALVGFRAAERTLALLRSIGSSGLARYIDVLARHTDADGVRELFTTWITLSEREAEALLGDVLASCTERAAAAGEFAAELRTAVELGAAYPDDLGVLAALLLNRVTLAPGEAIYLPAGNVHSYLYGTGIEILANSDNVLRCGLTPKHVDVPELLRVVDFSCGEVPVLTGTSDAGTGGPLVYRTDAPEFELSRTDWADGDADGVELTPGAPQILVCTRGSVLVRSAGDRAELELRAGNSVWVAANEPAVTVRPLASRAAQVFRGSPGTAPGARPSRS